MNRGMMALLACLALAGCTMNVKDEPVTSRPTIVVDKPIATRCIDPADIEPIPPTAMPKDGDVGQNAAGAVIDAKALRALAQRNMIRLRNCSSP